MEEDYKKMLVSKLFVYIQLGLVVLMVITDCPRILFFPCLILGISSKIAISLTEEDIYVERPALWPYRHLLALGFCFSF